MPGKSVDILLIEDNLAEARLLEEVLIGSSLSQFRFVHAKRLQEGLEHLRHDVFDVILLDLTLPDSQGLESLKPLIQQAPTLPIVVLTNTNDDELALEAVRQGAQDYLVKRHVTSEVLVRSLRYAIERKQASEALREANEALEQRVLERTVELAQANELLHQEIRERQNIQEELQRSNAELRQFAYVASHDLQEPLRTVTSFVQLLARRYHDQLDDNAQNYIHYIVDGTQRMQDLIQALLGYSRVGSTGTALVPTACDPLLNAILQRLDQAITESHAVITSDPLPVVMGNPVQIGQLFQNLVENAIKYRGEAAPQIHLSAVPQHKPMPSLTCLDGPSAEQAKGDGAPPLEEWLFSVKDNGIGIAPEHFDRIFLIFQRLHTRTEYPGTGIGLALCQKIVQRHGGQIWLESTPEVGTTFFFTLLAAPQ